MIRMGILGSNFGPSVQKMSLRRKRSVSFKNMEITQSLENMYVSFELCISIASAFERAAVA